MKNRNEFGRTLERNARRTATVRNGVIASRVSDVRYTVTLSDTGETVTATKAVAGDEFVVGQPVRLTDVSAAKTASGVGFQIIGSGTETAKQASLTPIEWAVTVSTHTHEIADVIGLTAALAGKVPTTRVITAGTGLSGGGDLSVDRTIDLEDTAVTPGTYTNSTFTVDQQGRLTAASSGTAGVTTARTLITTLPLRIDAGASADLSADRTFSINEFTGDAGAGGASGIVPAPATGDATKFLRGDKTWATAVTDVSGYVTLATDQTITGVKSFSKEYTGDLDIGCLLSYDLRAVAANVGGAIAFGGKYTGSTTITFGLIRGYKSNVTDGDTAGGLQFYTHTNGGAYVKHLDISPTGFTKVIADGDVVSGNFSEQFKTIPTDASGKGIRLGYDTSLGNGVIAPTGTSARLDFWTYQSAAWSRTGYLSSGLWVGEGLTAGFKHLAQAGGTNGIYTQIQDQRDYVNIDASSNAARSGAPGFLFRESHDDTATWTNLVLIGVNGDTVLHASGVEDATGATTGNAFIGCVNGTPTGVPARTVTGAVALRYDRAASKLWAYNGGWAEIGGGGSYQPLDAALTALAAGSDFVQFTGPLTSVKVFTLPDSNATLLYSGGALGTPSSGTLTNCSGTAASLTAGAATVLATPRAIYGNNFDGSAALTQVIASTYGGTGNGFTKFTGPTTAEKTFTLPDASATLLYDGGALGTPASGTLTNCSGTATSLIAGGLDATVSAGYLTVNGPTVARLMTVPDAAFTVARTDAGQTFTGNQIINGNLSAGNVTALVRFHAAAAVNETIAALASLPNGSAWIGNVGTSAGLSIGQYGGTYAWLQSRNQAAAGASYPIVINPLGGRVGINLDTPTARLHIAAGTATASTAPLKFTSGTLLGTAEAGAVEFNTDAYYGTITTGAARKTFAFLESPSFTTPTLGVATATSINKVTITAPATSATLTIADGKTLTASNTLTFAGTDSTTMTFPAVSSTLVGQPVAPIALDTQAAALGPSNIYASAPAGLYRATLHWRITQAATTSSTIGISIGWNNGAAQSFSQSTSASNTLWAESNSTTVIFWSAAGQNITYSTTYTSSGATPMQYSLRITLERLVSS